MNRIQHLAIAILIVCLSGIEYACAQHHSLADTTLMKIAKQYKYGIVREANPKKAAQIFNYLTYKGNSKAMVELGKCYLNGDGVRKDTKIAFLLFKKAAILGNVNAKCNLALMYQKGLNGKANYRKAYMLYKDAALSGSVHGLYGVGYLTYKGLGTEQNYREALKYLEEGADKGHSGCSMLLASYYANGYDGKQDMNKAEMYWRKASREGNGWTVDVTKNALVDSITKRIGKKGKWKHIKNNVLCNETMPKISNNVDSKDLIGLWSGNVYCYDWSRKNIMDEKNVKLKIEDNGNTLHVSFYIEDSLATSYFAVYENGSYVSKRLTNEQRMYPWTVTQTVFEKKGDKLFADLSALNLRNMAVQKPLLAILNKVSMSEDDEMGSAFSIVNVSYDGNEVILDITSTKNMDVDISFTTPLGVLNKQKKNQTLKVGYNKIRIPASFSAKDMTKIVTVHHKGERHSKVITVGNYE